MNQNKISVLKSSNNLENLIRLENEFPRNPLTVEQISEKIGETNHWWHKTSDFIFEYLSDAPNCLDFIQAKPPFADSAMPNPPHRYQRLRNAIIKLRVLAASSLDELNGNPTLRENLNSSTFFDVDNKGRITFSGTDLFTEAVKDVLAERIRSCQICQRVFWAKKIGLMADSKACSPQHTVNLRLRKSYDKNKNINKDLVNAKRRENYRYTKKINKEK